MISIEEFYQIEIMYLKGKTEMMSVLVEPKGFYDLWTAEKLRDKKACENTLYTRINAIYKLCFARYKFETFTDFKFYAKTIETGSCTDFEKMGLLIDYYKSNGFTSIEILLPMVKIYCPDVHQKNLENFFVNRVMNAEILHQLYQIYQIIKPWPFKS
jgi:hypothetical protein